VLTLYLLHANPVLFFSKIINNSEKQIKVNAFPFVAIEQVPLWMLQTLDKSNHLLISHLSVL